MPNVLVVDDTAVDSLLAGELIQESTGIEVSFAVNGVDALARFEHQPPDLLVTDLKMPEMDGLELVMKVRLAYPQVPVVLMTSKGSEVVAVQALEQGASSYVPKSQLNVKLRETVDNLLSMVKAEQVQAELMKCQKRVDLEFDLLNKPVLIGGFVDLVQQIIAGTNLTDHTGRFRLGVALREALLNAMIHGNLEISFEQMQDTRESLMTGGSEELIGARSAEPRYRDRRVSVQTHITPGEVRIVIRDQGDGFDHRAAMSDDAKDLVGSVEARKGRGLFLMRSFMDEVNFNDSGNKVTMVKWADAVEQ